MATSGEEMREIVESATAAVRGLSSAEDAELRRIAFERVLDHLLDSGLASFAESNGSAPADRRAGGGERLPSTEQQRVELLSEYFGVKKALVQDAIDLTDGEPVLHIPAHLIPKHKASATKLIAVVLTAVRGKVGLETTTQDIRDAVEAHGRLDKTNFASTLAGMPELIVLGEPGRADRLVRLRSAGSLRAREHLSQLSDAP